jgi:hypothetical protein
LWRKRKPGGGYRHGYRLRVFNGTTAWLHDNKGKGGVSVDRNYFPFTSMCVLIKRIFLLCQAVMCGQVGISVVMLDIMVK